MTTPKTKLKDTHFIDHSNRTNRDYSLGESDAEERLENLDEIEEEKESED